MARPWVTAAMLAAIGVGYALAGTVALVVAGAVTVACGPTWARGVRRRRTFIRPTRKVILKRLGEGSVELRVRGPLARPAKPLSPAEAATRRWYTARLEPAIRWLPDRTMRAWWTATRPVERGLALFQRPDPPRVKLAIRGLESPYLDDETTTFIESVIAKKIPLGDTVKRWDQHGTTITATWTPRRRPPAKVELAALEKAFPTLADHEFFAGLDAQGRAHIVSLEDDSPHIACSAGSGAGKSVLAMLLAVQVLRRGGRVVILDRKGSHRWARGLEGVTYCLKPEQMHDALIRLGGDAWSNQDTAFYSDDDGWTPDDRVLVIAEELNATFSWLRRHWAERGEKGQSPAVIAFQDLLFTGRTAHHHVFAVAQMLTANTVGGPEARENFGVRALARYSANNWKMLCAGVAMPRRSRVRGRWQFVVGDEATEVQVCYLTPAQARRFAGVPTKSGGGSYSPLTSDVPGDRGPIGDMADPLSEPISLRDAVDEGLFVSYDAAKKRLQRAPRGGAPKVVGRRVLANLYRRGDLVQFAAEQERVS